MTAEEIAKGPDFKQFEQGPEMVQWVIAEWLQEIALQLAVRNETRVGSNGCENCAGQRSPVPIPPHYYACAKCGRALLVPEVVPASL